jgi:hypothetical protein
MCAAALLCGARVPAAPLGRWLEASGVPSPEAQLVWRALLLSRQDADAADRRERRLDLARRALRWDAESARATRHAAALRIAEVGAEGPWPESGPVAELLVLLGSAPDGRRLAYRSGWLTPTTSARLEPALQAKLAVLFVQAADLDAIAAATEAWKEHEELLSAVCLAVAWRRFAGDAGLEAGPWLDNLDAVDESAWARCALGARGDPAEFAACVARAKHPALALAAEGRLPGPELARAAELELWHRDQHPRRDAYRCWVGLVRDLLLSGSDYARAFDARAQGFPYLPSDLQPGDRDFFEVAVEFFDWMVNVGVAVPEDYRLR